MRLPFSVRKITLLLKNRKKSSIFCRIQMDPTLVRKLLICCYPCHDWKLIWCCFVSFNFIKISFFHATSLSKNVTDFHMMSFFKTSKSQYCVFQKCHHFHIVYFWKHQLGCGFPFLSNILRKTQCGNRDVFRKTCSTRYWTSGVNKRD